MGRTWYSGKTFTVPFRVFSDSMFDLLYTLDRRNCFFFKMKFFLRQFLRKINVFCHFTIPQKFNEGKFLTQKTLFIFFIATCFRFGVLCARKERFVGAQFWYWNQQSLEFFQLSDNFCNSSLYMKRSNYFKSHIQTVFRNITPLVHLPVVPLLRYCLEMGADTVYNQCKNEMCFYVPTKTWLTWFSSSGEVKPRKIWRTHSFPGLHRQFFDTQLLKKKPHHNSAFQKPSNCKWSASMICGDEFGRCNESPQQIQVGRLWKIMKTNFCQKVTNYARKTNSFLWWTGHTKLIQPAEDATNPIVCFCTVKEPGEDDFRFYFRKHVAEGSPDVFYKTSK